MGTTLSDIIVPELFNPYVIQKTLEMRSAGIRYISGIRRYQLFGHSLMDDGK